jgi:hypothetical protein
VQGKRKWTALVATLATVVAAGAAAAGTIQVSGVQTPLDLAAGTSTMSGGLVGLWTTTSIQLDGYTPSGVVLASGTEEFDGCLDSNGSGACDNAERSGTISFSFTFTGKYDPATFAEQHGRCHHPITGGTGGFAGVEGVLEFRDDPVTGCAYYKGHLTL